MRSPQKFCAKSGQILNFLKTCFWVLDKFPRGEYSCHNNFTPLLRSSPTETMIEARRTSVPPSAEQELPGRKGPPPKLEPFPVVVFCWVVREHLPDCHICGALSLAKSLCLAIFAGIRVFLEMQPWMFHSIHGCLFFPNRKEQLL